MTIQIKSIENQKTLHSGDFKDFRACAEDAVQKNIALDYADFRNINLVNASLDNGSFRNACFDGANCFGANMSEADFYGASFKNVNFQGTCLCYSNLDHCHFEGAFFGGTDIAKCQMNHCVFDTISALFLDFEQAEKVFACKFDCSQGQHFSFSTTPIIIKGLDGLQVIFDGKYCKF